jgi:hypothetical protein
MTRRNARAVLVAGGVAVALLTACSSSGSGSGSGGSAAGSVAGGGGTATGTAATHASATGGDSATGGGSATCTHLTKAQVQPLLTDPITVVKVGAGDGGVGQMCSFRTESDDGLFVTVVGGKLAAGAYQDAVSELDKPVSVSGIGDKAARDGSADSSALVSTGGGVYCTADVTDDGDVPGTDRLYVANGHHTNIGDKAFGIVAAALGTLCNRVFGSGNTTPDLSGLASIPASSLSSPDDLPTSFPIPTDGPTS